MKSFVCIVQRLLAYFVVFSFLFSPQALGCQDNPVGITDSSIIPDNRFTSSSYYDNRYVPKYGRLNGAAKGWGPKTTTDPNDYLQIDLGEVFVICAVATQGCKDCAEWTTQYKISTSIDNSIWATYKDGKTNKLFTGNTNRNTAVKNVLDVPFLVRFIRFTPTGYFNWKALRVEAYGIRRDVPCRSLPVGIGNGKIPDSSMTSSSTYNSTTSPSKARLGYTAGSSWCAATSDSSPYLQINLVSPYIICGVATQGDHVTDQWIQSYQMTISANGFTFTKYIENNQSKSFVGNFDSKSVVNNVLYDGTVGQYIRVRPTSHYGTTNCMRTEVYGIQQTGVCTFRSVGLSLSSMIPDYRFSASSYYNHNYLPSDGRLITSSKSWGPKTTSGGDWLQIDLGSVVYACAVATQGVETLHSVEWVTRYKLKVSLDNVDWNYYKENNIDKEFTGNTDSYSVVTNNLTIPTKAKFIRFYPTADKGWPSLRVEVYGVSSACSSPVGLEKSKVMANMTSSSDLDNTHTASHGRLYGNSSWCSNTLSNNEFLQINLGQVMTVTGIATQGDHTMDKWVKTYTISYSIDGNLWNTYKTAIHGNKIFTGNSNKDNIMVRWLSHPLTARHVRVTPQSWNTAICMRMELYGCNYPTRPVITGLTNQNLTAAAYSYVDLVCIVQEPLIQYIKWYTGNTDITSQSTGLVRGANGVTSSTLRINYTNADNVLNTYRCIWSDTVLCSKPFSCRAMYENTKNETGASPDTGVIGRLRADKTSVYIKSKIDAIKSAGVTVKLDYPSTLPTPRVDNIKSTSVTIRWTKPVLRFSQAKVTSYVLQYQNILYTQTINVSPLAISHMITGLVIFTNYSVKIKTVSRVGHGKWSQAKNFRTDSALPLASPMSIAAYALTSQSIHVTWQAPTSGVNGQILGYTIIFSPVSTAAPINITTKQTAYNITNLLRWTTYRINVSVFNDKGNGPAAAIIQRTLEDAPTQAPNNLSITVLSSSSVQLLWSLPPINSRNGNIRGFEVYYKKTGSSERARIIVLPGNCTGTYTITGLEKYTTYTIKVLAYTKPNKKGPYTNSIDKTTNQDAPSAPTNLQILEIAPNGSTGPQVKLTWDSPLSPNGIIQYYIVTLRYNEGSPAIYKGNFTGISPMNVTLPVFGGVTYWFSVKAVTVKEGNQTTKKVDVKVYAPSQEPGNFSVTVLSSSSVRLSWRLTPIDSRNGIIRGFEVYYKKTGSSERARIMVLPGNCTRTYTITGLEKYTTYTFKVLAYTEPNKKGPYTNSTDKTTNQDAPSAPTNLQILEIAPNGSTGPQVKLTWDSPLSPNGIIQYYIVTLRYNEGSPAIYKGNFTGISPMNVTLPVFGGVTYWFSVKAVTVKEGNQTTKKVDVKVYAPSQEPGNFSVTVLSSSSVRLSWRLTPIDSRNGIIRGFEVYYKKTGSSERARIMVLPGNCTRTYTITGLEKYTTYTFKVLAYTEPNKKGPYSNIIETTMQDAPSAPTNLQTLVIAPHGSTGPQVKLTWDVPSSPNGIIQYYIVSCRRNNKKGYFIHKANVTGALSVTLPVFGGVTYWFNVIAVTIKKGNQTTKKVDVHVYAPTAAPKTVRSVELNATTIIVQWKPLNTNNGLVTIYELIIERLNKQSKIRSKSEVSDDLEKVNVTCCNATLNELSLCSKYAIYVRAYTSAGPGPDSKPAFSVTSEPGPPSNLVTTVVEKRKVTLQWNKPLPLNKPVKEYIISFNGTNLYEKHVEIHSGQSISVSATVSISNLQPATYYMFQVSAKTECGVTKMSKVVTANTSDDVPPPPVVGYLSNITESVNNISLWKASNVNGIIRAYQVIVEKVLDTSSLDVTKLMDYNKAKEEGLLYYIAAEIRTDNEERYPQSFTVGDEKVYNGFINMKLEHGKKYYVSQRALTQDKQMEYLVGPASLIGEGKVRETNEEICSGQPSQTTITNKNSIYLCISLSFNAAFVVYIILSLTYIKRLKIKYKEKRLLNSELTSSTAVQGVYENPSAVSTAEGLPMTFLPQSRNSDYEQIDLTNSEVVGQLNTSNSHYQSIHFEHDNQSDVGLQQPYASLQPETKKEAPQEDRKGSTLQITTYQSLQKDRSKLEYQCLHTYANTLPNNNNNNRDYMNLP